MIKRGHIVTIPCMVKFIHLIPFPKCKNLGFYANWGRLSVTLWSLNVPLITESSCLSGRCIYSSPVPVCYMIEQCQCTDSATNLSLAPFTCCVQAIDFLIYKKTTMTRKLCYIPPGSEERPGEMACGSVKSLCDTLKRSACEDVCRKPTQAR